MTLDDNHMTLQMRVKRNVEIQYAFDRDPPPRTRRVVTNVSVFRTENPDEYDVVSYLLFLRNQYDLVGSDMLTATREDVLRRTDDGLRLARRRIIIDVCTLPEPFPNVLF
jgi:3-phenylpropionate/cinnamic acid dioxygenase small subunit